MSGQEGATGSFFARVGSFTADGHGNISPMMQNEGAVAVPFVQGKLLERDGAYVVKYKANKANLETTVVTEAIFAVTCLSEDRILAP